MKRMMRVILIVGCFVLLLQSGCTPHAKRSDYSVETIYQSDGYISALSYRIYCEKTYPPTAEIFGMALDGVEYPYTTIRSDNTIAPLSYQKRSDLIHELEQKFRRVLPDEQAQLFSEVDLRAYAEFEDKIFLLFESAASISAASSNRYPCILVQCEHDLQVTSQIEFIMAGDLDANCLTIYSSGYLCVSPRAYFEYAKVEDEDIENSVWFDRSLNILDEPPIDVQEYLLSKEDLRQYLRNAEQEEIALLADDIQKIYLLERVGDVYCCLFRQESVTQSHFYIELDLQGNVLLAKHLQGMSITSAQLKTFDKNSDRYYDVVH